MVKLQLRSLDSWRPHLNEEKPAIKSRVPLFVVEIPWRLVEQLLHLFWRAPDSIAVQPSQPSFDSSAHYADQLGSVRLGGLTHRSDLARALPTPAAGVRFPRGTHTKCCHLSAQVDLLLLASFLGANTCHAGIYTRKNSTPIGHSWWLFHSTSSHIIRSFKS